jgi:peptidoglycan hydrolase-like protein with peptidoglycan-binding domain
MGFPQTSGDRGLEVLELQQALTNQGFPVATDRVFGDETKRTVVAFFHSVNIPVPAFISPPVRRIWPLLGLPIDKTGVPGLLDPG